MGLRLEAAARGRIKPLAPPILLSLTPHRRRFRFLSLSQSGERPVINQQVTQGDQVGYVHRDASPNNVPMGYLALKQGRSVWPLLGEGEHCECVVTLPLKRKINRSIAIRLTAVSCLRPNSLTIGRALLQSRKPRLEDRIWPSQRTDNRP
jgi:hypothetical protein